MDIERLSKCVKLKLEQSYMKATLVPLHAFEESVSVEDFLDFLENNGIVHGILEETIGKIVEDIGHWIEPVIIAMGSEPISGDDGYIKPISTNDGTPIDKDSDFVDLRSFTQIPSVKKGDRIADIIHHTEGVPGMNVKGEPVPTKPGKPIKLKKCKNAIIDHPSDGLYATADGQISYQKRAVHVLPIYEVKGDLDLKTGNLSFIGNIHIHGDVPSGYTISAEGDIRINGIVEASTLKAGGSVFIRNGIAGQGKAVIEAGSDLHTGYINQGTVKVGGDLHVRLINYSDIVVDGSIFCQKGKGIIFGGHISAGKDIFVNQTGTNLMTKTYLYLGTPGHILDQCNHLSRQISIEEDNLKKLKTLQETLESKYEPNRDEKEMLLLLKVKNTYGQTECLLDGLKKELDELTEDLVPDNDQVLVVNGVIYPGVEVTFGKYKRVMPHEYKAIELKLASSEVVIQSLR
ncbi:DUF342 domain-containing protein [Pseudalkalibacillus salsuginis]|uniref:DUF342 domain-containing protein n=1 Tax=Pseudalkalibacillus salsuginis TaxID=2910972 RepID=UPI001F330A4E|nr:FapA family protein [Pseudalkalibacillus salsuginis]MCF6410593.1 FapA family protein [Pseudalkalibacillus salsuginis]